MVATNLPQLAVATAVPDGVDQFGEPVQSLGDPAMLAGLSVDGQSGIAAPTWALPAQVAVTYSDRADS